jgi:hypothetical protein
MLTLEKTYVRICDEHFYQAKSEYAKDKEFWSDPIHHSGLDDSIDRY